MRKSSKFGGLCAGRQPMPRSKSSISAPIFNSAPKLSIIPFIQPPPNSLETQAMGNLFQYSFGSRSHNRQGLYVELSCLFGTHLPRGLKLVHNTESEWRRLCGSSSKDPCWLRFAVLTIKTVSFILLVSMDFGLFTSALSCSHCQRACHCSTGGVTVTHPIGNLPHTTPLCVIDSQKVLSLLPSVFAYSWLARHTGEPNQAWPLTGAQKQERGIASFRISLLPTTLLWV